MSNNHDRYIWEAALKLLDKIQWQPIGRKFDTGDRQNICPVCRESKFQGHQIDCELDGLISAIGSRIYG